MVLAAPRKSLSSNDVPSARLVVNAGKALPTAIGPVYAGNRVTNISAHEPPHKRSTTSSAKPRHTLRFLQNAAATKIAPSVVTMGRYQAVNRRWAANCAA